MGRFSRARKLISKGKHGSLTSANMAGSPAIERKLIQISNKQTWYGRMTKRATKMMTGGRFTRWIGTRMVVRPVARVLKWMGFGKLSRALLAFMARGGLLSKIVAGGAGMMAIAGLKKMLGFGGGKTPDPGKIPKEASDPTEDNALDKSLNTEDNLEKFKRLSQERKTAEANKQLSELKVQEDIAKKNRDKAASKQIDPNNPAEVEAKLSELMKANGQVSDNLAKRLDIIDNRIQAQTLKVDQMNENLVKVNKSLSEKIKATYKSLKDKLSIKTQEKKGGFFAWLGRAISTVWNFVKSIGGVLAMLVGGLLIKGVGALKDGFNWIKDKAKGLFGGSKKDPEEGGIAADPDKALDKVEAKPTITEPDKGAENIEADVKDSGKEQKEQAQRDEADKEADKEAEEEEGGVLDKAMDVADTAAMASMGYHAVKGIGKTGETIARKTKPKPKSKPKEKQSLLGKVWGKVKDGAKWVKNKVSGGIKKVKNLASKGKSLLSKGWDWLKGGAKKAWGKVKSVGKAAWSGIKKGAKFVGKLGKQFFNKVLSPVGKFITGKVFKKIAKIVGSRALKTVLKRIPVVGLVAGLGYGIARAVSGDWAGAGLELASGAASLIDLVPGCQGVGTAVGLGIDAVSMARDIKNEMEEDPNGKEDGSIRMNDDGTIEVDDKFLDPSKKPSPQLARAVNQGNTFYGVQPGAQTNFSVTPRVNPNLNTPNASGRVNLTPQRPGQQPVTMEQLNKKMDQLGELTLQTASLNMANANYQNTKMYTINGKDGDITGTSMT